MMNVSNTSHRYTEEIDNIIRLRYSNDATLNKQLACEIGRTYEALKARAIYLGVTKRHRNGWSPRIDETLLELASHYPLYLVAKKLKRSQGSIRGRLRFLGANSRSVREDFYTLGEVCQILGVGYRQLNKWVDSGKLRALRNTVNTEKTPYYITKQELKMFIRRYALELSGRNVDIVQVVEVLCGIDYNMNRKERPIGGK